MQNVLRTFIMLEILRVTTKLHRYKINCNTNLLLIQLYTSVDNFLSFFFRASSIESIYLIR